MPRQILKDGADYKNQILGSYENPATGDYEVSPIEINRDGHLIVQSSSDTPSLGTGLQNVRTSIFSDLIIGTRKPTLQMNYSHGIPLEYFNTNILNGGTLSIEQTSGEPNGNMILSTSSNPASICQIATRRTLRYMMGHESYLGGTAAFSIPQPDSEMMFGLANLDEAEEIVNGFLFEYQGIEFGVSRYTGGIRTEFIPRADFNGDFDSSVIDLNMLSIVQITFAYYGVAPIIFWYFDGEHELTTDGKIIGVGKWRILHQIKYAGTSDKPHSTNPNMSMFARTKNKGNVTPISLKTASFEFGNVSGASSDLDASARSQNYIIPPKTINGGATGQIIAAFRSPFNVNMISSYDGITIGYDNFLNTITSKLMKLSLINDGGSTLTVELWLVKNSAITGGTFVPVLHGDSILSISTNATYSLVGGRRLDIFLVDRTASEIFTFINDQMLLNPDYTALFIGFATHNTVTLANKWKELF